MLSPAFRNIAFSGSLEIFLVCDGWRGMADDPDTLSKIVF
jgi:hypothetical protein